MKKLHVASLNVASLKLKTPIAYLACLLSAGLLMSSVRVSALEDPIGCSRVNVPPGLGNTSQGGINFNVDTAHIGDTVQVFPNLGMAGSVPPTTPFACRSINATGFVYIANSAVSEATSVPLLTFLENVTLDPGVLISCPTDVKCRPGPYNITITAAMVGAPVYTPNNTASARPGWVRVAQHSVGTVLAGVVNEQLQDFHTDSIRIVTPCIKVFKFDDILPGQTCYTEETPIRFRGYVTNCGDITLTNVTVIDTRVGQVQLLDPVTGAILTEPVSLATNAYAVFSNSFRATTLEICQGFATNIVSATARDISVVGGPNAVVVHATTNSIHQICSRPGIVVSKRCPQGPVEAGGVLIYSGTVSNSGDITLTNVTVVNNQPPGNNTPLFPYITLRPRQSFTFEGSYTVPLDCGPYVDTLTVRAQTICGLPLTSTATASCRGTNTPSIDVVKNCPVGLLQPGDTSVVTGTVTNTGNVTLQNVMVTNVVGTASRRVLGPISLAPGAGTGFSDSYVIPLDSCGPYADTVVATGADQCYGRVVTDSDTKACPGTNSPSIDVVKNCQVRLLEPGKENVVTGTVTNTGNITLVNVVVSNILGTASRRLLGPITLAPFTGASFTNAYDIPLDSCGPYVDTVVASGVDKCYQRVVTDSDTKGCPGTNSPSIWIVKNCPTEPVGPNGFTFISGVVSNAGNITLTNILVVDNQPTNNTPVLGPIDLAPGQIANFIHRYQLPTNICNYSDTVSTTGRDKCFGRTVSASASATCPTTTSPSLDVVKVCPVGLLQPGQPITVTGTVTNTGNITLNNVVVTNTIAALGNVSRRVLGPITLAPGAGTSFSDLYTIPLDSCGPYADTFAASGTDQCNGKVVTDSDTAACLGTNNPSIDVVKACPPGLVQPGQLTTVTGTVTNKGNITLTNVLVWNTLGASTAPRQVLGPISLAPGAGTNFSDTYTVPLDSCGPFRDTFIAVGNDKCFGRLVEDSDTASCPGTNSPRLFIVKYCPQQPVAPNEWTTISGVVSNAGNVTLTNILVYDNQPTNNTLLLGPITLPPGGSAQFFNRYQLPPNCCTYFDTVRTTGADQCYGRTVSASATAACPTLTTPGLTVTKVCGPAVALGQLLVFSGEVRNTGNITLTNITVVNSQPAPNTPVLGPITLAPGERMSFTGSYRVPTNDLCSETITDTLTARGYNICTGTNTIATATQACRILWLDYLPRPLLVVTKNCGQPVPPGGTLSFSGTVSNAGNMTLTNVVVVNDHPTNNTPVLVIPTLAPNQSTNFSGSYRVCRECCPPYVDTISAWGFQRCDGTRPNVETATATAACPGISKPSLAVTVYCPTTPARLGELVFYSGIVSNSGDMTVSSVLVSDNHSGFLTQIPALAAGETSEFFSPGYLATNCGPNAVTLVTVTAFDACTYEGVTNVYRSQCAVICPAPQSLVLINPQIVGGPATGGSQQTGLGQQFEFYFATEVGRAYTVEYSDSLVAQDWQPLPGFIGFTGDGNVATITDVTVMQRFYRVVIQ